MSRERWWENFDEKIEELTYKIVPDPKLDYLIIILREEEYKEPTWLKLKWTSLLNALQKRII